jgi:hypothetical protein
MPMAKPDAEFNHLIGKARDAKLGGREAWAVQSTGEKVAVALILNKADWLASMGYSLAEAIDRTGAQWLPMLAIAERALRDEE